MIGVRYEHTLTECTLSYSVVAFDLVAAGRMYGNSFVVTFSTFYSSLSFQRGGRPDGGPPFQFLYFLGFARVMTGNCTHAPDLPIDIILACTQ